MDIWTKEDQEKNWCAPEDVGQPKIDHERWQWSDFDAGTIPGYLVDTPKPPSAWSTEPKIAPPIDAATQASIMKTLVKGSVTPQTQTNFNKWADANPSVYFPLLAKYNLASDMKEPPKALPDLDDLTDEQIEGMSSNDVKRILLKSVGITKKSELDALKD